MEQKIVQHYRPEALYDDRGVLKGVLLNSPKALEVRNRLSLRSSIENGDQKGVTSALRALTQPLPVDIAHALADFIDPDRPPVKSGPKVGRTHNRDVIILNSFVRLRESPDMVAQVVFNVDLDAFNIAEPFDRTFYVYPQHPGCDLRLGKFNDAYSRGQTNLRAPTVGELRDYILERCGISSRTLDSIVSRNGAEQIRQRCVQALSEIMAGYRKTYTREDHMP